MFLAIVPAYNEQNSIDSVVQSLFNHVDLVVVVDDGSQDNTFYKAKQAGAVVLRHELNRGQGAALETGHEYARQVSAEYILHFDGDGQFDVQDINPALTHMKEKQADVLFGSRFLDDRSNTPWLKKNIIFPIAKIVHKVFGGAKLTDVHNGFRILHRDALSKIKLTQDRMAHATEIPALAKTYNLRYIEYPVKVVYRRFGQNTAGGMNIVKDLLFGKFVG
jgi:polyprenyl-phospho-N-acetylgalactosaminyl synthase